jgi:hypothetical protein
MTRDLAASPLPVSRSGTSGGPASLQHRTSVPRGSALMGVAAGSGAVAGSHERAFGSAAAWTGSGACS